MGSRSLSSVHAESSSAESETRSTSARNSTSVSLPAYASTEQGFSSSESAVENSEYENVSQQMSIMPDAQADSSEPETSPEQEGGEGQDDSLETSSSANDEEGTDNPTEGDEEDAQQETQEEEHSEEEGEENEEEAQSEEDSEQEDELAGASGGTEDEQAFTPLVATLPRLTPIKTPFVHAPPPQAMARKEKIIESTGSPPELHHTLVRDAAQRVTQAARDAQRQMIIRVGLTAKDTRISIEDMADEVWRATQAGVSKINNAIDQAIADIGVAASDEIDHIEEHGVRTGEDIQENRDRMVVDIYEQLKSGSTKIQEAEDIARGIFDEKLPAAERFVFAIPESGQVGRLATTGADGEVSAGAYSGEDGIGVVDASTEQAADFQIIGDTKRYLNLFIDQQAIGLSDGGANLKEDLVTRATPHLDGRADAKQTNLVENAQQAAERMSSDASRAQFMTMVLGLTTPVSQYHEQDQTASTNQENDTATAEMTAAERSKIQAQQTVEEKSTLAAEYADRDLRERLTNNLWKVGRKARKGLIQQANQAEIALNSSTELMAEDYVDLIRRLDDLIEEGKFLDKRTLVPRMLAARDSLQKLLENHEAVAAMQAENTIDTMENIKEEQVDGIRKNARESADSVQDVVTRTVFDMSMFSSMMTGNLSDGAFFGITAAQEYAERMTEGILNTDERVRGPAMEQVENIAANFCNSSISNAESAQFRALQAFVEFMEQTGEDGPLSKVMLDEKEKLRKRADELDHAMPSRDADVVAGGVAAGMLIPGAQLYAGVALAVYLYETDPDEDKVVELLADLPWPGCPATGDLFKDQHGDDLQDRIGSKLDNPHRATALGLFSESEVARGIWRLYGIENSTGWFDLSREAREALGQGMSADEHSALQQFAPEMLAETAQHINDELDEHERDISLAYINNNRERAVAARTMEAIDKGRDDASWGWIFSAEEAQNRSDRARVDAMGNMRELLRQELAIELGYVTDADLNTATSQVYREVASLTDPRNRSADQFTDEQGRQAMIDFATRGHAAAVLDFNVLGLVTPLAGPVMTADIEQISTGKNARQYIEDVVNFGSESDEARASRATFEIAEGEEHEGIFGTEELTETAQNRITDAVENPRLSGLQQELDDIDRQIEEAGGPENAPGNLLDRRERLQGEFNQEQSEHRGRLQIMARQLGAPADEISTPEAAERYMAQRVGDLFARADGLTTQMYNLGRSDEDVYSHSRYGQEMITGGRASLEAGAALATEGLGTNDDLLLRSYRNRSQEEYDAARSFWQARYGEDMDVAMGIKDREWEADDYALFAMSPVGWFATRGSETSGDLAMELQRIVDNEQKTDLDRSRAQAMRYHQERVRGTGFIAQHTMEGTDEQVNLDASQERLASMILEEARRHNPEAAERFAGDPTAIYSADGTLDPAIEAAAFENGNFRGDRTLFADTSRSIGNFAESYRNEIARQESMITTTISILALIATVALMLIPGVNAVAAGIAVAIISGTATMVAKAGMRGERYGWEEAANDAAMMAVEAASAGFGGALGGGLGKTNMLARMGGALNKSLGKVGGAVAREAISGALSAGAQRALNEDTWKDGFLHGLENIGSSALKNAAISGVAAGVSEGMTNKLNSAVLGEVDPAKMNSLQRAAANAPHRTAAITEALSEFVGTAASETVGVAIEYANGEFKGKFGDALTRIGGAALRDMAVGGFRGAVNSLNKQRYQDLLEAARSSSSVSDSELRALRLVGISAGVLNYDSDIGEVRREVTVANTTLARLPQALREQATRLDTDSLEKLISLIDSGGFGSDEKGQQARHEFIVELRESVPGLNGEKLMGAFDSAIEHSQASRATPSDISADTRARVRSRLSSDLNPELQRSLDGLDIEGLHQLSDSDLAIAAAMIQRGSLDADTADALFRKAREKNPDLDEFSFLNTLHRAVETANHARNLEIAIVEANFQSVMENIAPEDRALIASLPKENIADLKQKFAAQDLGSPADLETLYRLATDNNPNLKRADFDKILERGLDNAARKQQQARAKARAEREQRMSNIPAEQRAQLSVLPDYALVELRIRQMEGDTLSPASKKRLIEAALKEAPDTDVEALKIALDEAVRQPAVSVSADKQAKLREELLASVPRAQQGEMQDIPILVMRDAEFEALTRSQSGQAVTMIIHGEPVVVMRESADPSVLREEGLHVLQTRDPDWAEKIKSLDEISLAEWDALPLAQQLAVYQNKIEIEVDAQRRLMDSLKGDIEKTQDPTEKARLQTRLNITEAALGNLVRRSMEMSSISDTHIRAMEAGIINKPDWLEQPARLFNKKDMTARTDTEPGSELERQQAARDFVNGQLSDNVSEATAKKYQKIAEKIPFEHLHALTTSVSGPEQLRSLLSRLNDADPELVKARSQEIVVAMQRLSNVEKQVFVDAIANSHSIKEAHKFIRAIPELHAASLSDSQFRMLVDLCFDAGNLKLNQLELLQRVIAKTEAKDLENLLILTDHSDHSKKLLSVIDQVEDPATLIDRLIEITDGFEHQDRESVIDWLVHSNQSGDPRARPISEVIAMVDNLHTLRSNTPNENTFRNLFLQLYFSKSSKPELLESLAQFTGRLDKDGRIALEKLLQHSDKTEHVDIIEALILLHDASIKPIQGKIDPENGQRLLNLIMEMAVTRTQWKVFIDDSIDFFGTLATLPRTDKNIEAIEKIMAYISKTKDDTSLSAEDRHAEMEMLAADITGAVKDLRDPVATDSKETQLKSTAEREDAIQRQVKRMESGGDEGRLSGGDAWLNKLDNEAPKWAGMQTDKDSRLFAEIVQKSLPGLSDGEYASLSEMRLWIEKLAEIRGIDTNDAKAMKDLLDDVIERGLGNTRKDLKSKDRFDKLARAFREMTVEAHDSQNPRTFNEAEALKQIGLTKADLDARSDGKKILEHLRALSEQQEKYETMQQLAKEIGASTAGMAQSVTEAKGEIAFTHFILENFPHFKMERGFEKGTGYDQVWAVRDAQGKLTEAIIGEAKGPGAGLGNPHLGPQMGVAWVVGNMKKMMNAGDPLAFELRDLAKASKEQGKAMIFGRTTEAVDNPKPPPDFLPKEVQSGDVGYDIGQKGYDFSTIDLPKGELEVKP